MNQAERALQMRREFIRRLESMKQAAAAGGKEAISVLAAGRELGLLWARDLVQTHGSGLDSLLVAIGVSEGLLIGINEATDARN